MFFSHARFNEVCVVRQTKSVCEDRLHNLFYTLVEKDPNYALAYAGMAECYYLQTGFSSGDSRESHPKARAYATRAIEMDETLDEAHTTLAGIKFLVEWDWPGAEKGYRRAIELDPGSATAHQRYSLFLMSVGRTEEALTEIKRALELDPVSISVNSSLGWRLSRARRHDQAIEQLRKTLEMDPNYGGAYLYLGEAYVQKGMYAEAITALNRAIALSQDRALVSLGYCYAVSGQRTEAERVLVKLREISKRQNISS
jgi:tetratricopeptide (TPR) repeat protein